MQAHSLPKHVLGFLKVASTGCATYTCHTYIDLHSVTACLLAYLLACLLAAIMAIHKFQVVKMLKLQDGYSCSFQYVCSRNHAPRGHDTQPVKTTPLPSLVDCLVKLGGVADAQATVHQRLPSQVSICL